MRIRATATGAAALACALAAVLMLALGGCGGDSPTASARGETTAAGKEETANKSGDVSVPTANPSNAKTCAAQLGDLVSQMDVLRNSLVAGLSYEQYVDRVKGLRATYHHIPARKVALGCLKATARPAEAGLDLYIDASNAWSGCVETAGCESASIETELQAKWREASEQLSKAQRGLGQRNAG
jgi:hypothetical protein